MINRLTFSNVIGILLENKKKTYTQYQMVQSIFSQYLDDTLTSADLYAEDMTQYSRWCNGERPIPKDIIQHYENNNLWNIMEQDFRDKIIPNLINESQARSKTEDLLDKSIDVLGKDKVQELKNISDNSSFFAEMVRYVVLNDHSQNITCSPDLSETLLSGRVPSCTKDFLGRKKELSEVTTTLKKQSSTIYNWYCRYWKKRICKAFCKKE